MKMKILLIFLALLFPATNAAAEDITSDTTWSGSITIDEAYNIRNSSTLTIEPGTTVTFQSGGKITIYWSSTLNAQGATFIGESDGGIAGYDAHLIIDNCTFTDMGMSDDRNRVIDVDTESGGQITIQNSQFDNCGSLYLKPVTDGSAYVANNTLTNHQGGIQLYGTGDGHVITENTIDQGSLSITGDCGGTVSYNVFANGTIGHYTSTPVLLEYNYINSSDSDTTVLHQMDGTIINNVIKGGEYTSAYIGGVIEGNVFISLPPVDGSVNDSTHEHLCGLNDDSTVERNIFVGNSYGAIMAIGSGTASRAMIRNNTFDMRDIGWAYYVHAPTAAVEDGTFINNLLIRTSGARIEGDYTSCLTTWDYNLWSDLSGDKFSNFTISGKTEGDQGFGLNDLPDTGSYPRDEVVANADIEFPFTDEQMLNKTHTTEELLDAYRQAYTPVEGSEAINNGYLQVTDDPFVTDGQPDIGAVEYGETTSEDTLAPSISETSPADGDTDVAVNTTISFTIIDSGDGVDSSSIELRVNRDTISNQRLEIEGEPASYTVTYTPRRDFSRRANISVAVDAQDLAGNEMSTYTWSFTTEGNSSPPGCGISSSPIPGCGDSSSSGCSTSN